MPTSPSRFFGDGNIGPVVYGARTLWLAHWFTLPSGSRFHLLRERSRPTPRQGLTVRCRDKRHKLRINGQEANRFVLWADTAPRHIEVEVPAGRHAREIGLANVWELPEYGTTMMGVNAASMAISEVSPGQLLLECSDGYGLEDPEFTDLVVRLVIEPSSAAPAT